MRSIFAKTTAVFIAAILLLCGCTNAATNEKYLPKSFTATADVDFEDTVYEMLMTRYGDGVWEIELTSPAVVSGLIFSIDGEGTTISFKGLHFTFDSSKFPVGSVVSLAVKSFDRLAPLTMTVTEGESTDYCSGEENGTAYSLTFSKTGIPLVLELGGSSDENFMRITFIEFELLSGDGSDNSDSETEEPSGEEGEGLGDNAEESESSDTVIIEFDEE